MFHSDTQRLIAVWTALAERAAIPPRAAFDPVDLGLLLPRAFTADRRIDGATVRLAGGWIERLHGRPLRDADWLDGWTADSRPMVAAAVARTFREARPVVLLAAAGEAAAPVEVTLAPLRSPGGRADRILGLYAPTTAAGADLVEAGPLTARAAVGVGPVRRAPLQLAAVDGRLTA